MRLQLRKLHERIANQRRDFHFKIAHRLYEHSDYDLVACEDLQIRNLDRDENAAINILAVASAVRGEAWNTTLETPHVERSEKLVNRYEVGQLQAPSFRAG